MKKQCDKCGHITDIVWREDLLSELIPKKYVTRVKDILRIVGIYGQDGTETVVERLKIEGIIAKTTWYGDVKFLDRLLEAWTRN